VTITDPHDIAAEQAVVGAMLISPRAATEMAAALSGDDFYRPAHAIVFDAAVRLHRAGTIPDPVTVKDELEHAAQLTQAGGALYLHTLIAAVPSPANAGYYARIVRDKAVRRRVLLAGRRITQAAAGDDFDDAHGLAEWCVREVEAAREAGQGDGITAVRAEEFLAAADDDYDWVIPGLLERGDRLVITGTEGGGKTTCLRQLAVCAAAGIHPFTGRACPQSTVLVVDFENGAPLGRRRLRPLVAQARLLGRPVDGRLWVECRPGRVDLTRDRDVSWLLRQVAAVKPDIVAIGPLYRMSPRALNDDTDVAPVLSALDMVRDRGACLILEAHPGHGLNATGSRDMRPRGSAALMGWPEFGYGLRPCGDNGLRAVEMVPWRGDRDERDWPRKLIAGGDWPWHAG
jgi:DnaB-like helicase N terminal domain/AAA domain